MQKLLDLVSFPVVTTTSRLLADRFELEETKADMSKYPIHFTILQVNDVPEVVVSDAFAEMTRPYQLPEVINGVVGRELTSIVAGDIINNKEDRSEWYQRIFMDVQDWSQCSLLHITPNNGFYSIIFIIATKEEAIQELQGIRHLFYKDLGEETPVDVRELATTGEFIDRMEYHGGVMSYLPVWIALTPIIIPLAHSHGMMIQAVNANETRNVEGLVLLGCPLEHASANLAELIGETPAFSEVLANHLKQDMLTFIEESTKHRAQMDPDGLGIGAYFNSYTSDAESEYKGATVVFIQGERVPESDQILVNMEVMMALGDWVPQLEATWEEFQKPNPDGLPQVAQDAKIEAN